MPWNLYPIFGPVPVNGQKSGQIWIFFQKVAQCSETYEKHFSDFYFLTNGRFCTENTQKVDQNKSLKMAKKNVVTRNAQCYETYEKNNFLIFAIFIFLRNGRFCAENS